MTLSATRFCQTGSVPYRSSWKRARAAALLAAITGVVAHAQTFTTIYSFGVTGGQNPTPALVQGTNGDLYGTTWQGGNKQGGTVFKISPSGRLTTIYNFCSESRCTDGAHPGAALIQASNGYLYGTTTVGGAYGTEHTGGTVFQISPGGTMTKIYSFCAQNACADGSEPLSGLVQASNGYLYGTTTFGGANGEGTVFKITPSGTLTTLYSFCAQFACDDGQNPLAALIQAADGDLYGTTEFGGANAKGTLFKITPNGQLTKLYTFCASGYPCADGEWPATALVQTASGDFYGTTNSGGITFGALFSKSPQASR